jgi:hypothetical protein
MKLKSCLFFIVFHIAFSACSQSSPKVESSGSSIKAHGVRIEIAKAEGRIEIRGDELLIEDGGERMLLTGNTSLKMQGDSVLEARASRITLFEKEPKIMLTGGVEARFGARAKESGDAAR